MINNVLANRIAQIVGIKIDTGAACGAGNGWGGCPLVNAGKYILQANLCIEGLRVMVYTKG